MEHKDTKTQSFLKWNTETQRRRDFILMEHKDTKTQRLKNSETQKLRNSKFFILCVFASQRSKIQTPPLTPPLEGRGAAARRDTEVPDPSVSLTPPCLEKYFFVSLCLCVP